MRAVIIGVLFSVFVVGNHCQQAQAQPGTIQRASEKAPPETITPLAQTTSVKQEQAGCQKTAHYLKRAFGPEYLAAWILVIAAGIGLYVTWRTAKAALLNAQAVINAERAWLTITIQKDASINGPIASFVNFLRNEGRTPARLKTIHIDRTFSSPDQLPISPRYTGVVAVPENMFVVNNNGFPIGIPFDPKKMLVLHHGRGVVLENAVETPQKFLIFYGRITYEDVFNVEGREIIEHETRWCYAWVAEGEKFVMAGPAEYTRNA